MDSETREERRQVLISAVDQFLDHIEEDFEGSIYVNSVVIAAEINVPDLDATMPSYWCSNENPIWQRGFFEILADYRRLERTDGIDDDE